MVYGDQFAGHAGNQWRFGQEADWRLSVLWMSRTDERRPGLIRSWTGRDRFPAPLKTGSVGGGCE